MSYIVEVRPEALVDIETAADWYETQEVGLGTDFLRTFIEALHRLPLNPFIYRLRDRRRNVRWLLLNHFPYKVVYQIVGNRLIVLAVLHQARRDRHWRRRI